MSQKFRANVNASKYGLAIVTGGSSGIGKSIIEQLLTLESPPSVFNLSRRKPTSFYNGQDLHHLECDLSDRAQRGAAFDELEQEIERSSATGKMLLINNAGYGLYGNVDNAQPRQHLDLLEVNILALVELSARLLPRIKQRGGSIMNIASTAAFQATPHLATYGASKAFVLNWTLSLNEELRGTSARALAVCPGPTSTGFFKRAGFGGDIAPGGFSQTPEQVAKAALQAAANGKSFVVTGAANKLLVGLAGLLPRGLQTRASALVIKRMRSDS